MNDRREIDMVKGQLETLKEKYSDLFLEHLKLKRDIGSKVRHNRGDADRVLSAISKQTVECRDRLTALETFIFKGMKFEEIERIIGSGDKEPPKAS